MFENPEYQVDEQSEEFRLLNPIVSKVGKKRIKKLRQMAATQQVRLYLVITLVITDTMIGSLLLWQGLLEDSTNDFWTCLQVAEDEEEPEGRGSSEDESSDDDKSWVEEVREQRRLLRQEDRDRRRTDRKNTDRSIVLLESGQSQQTSDMAEKRKTNQLQFYQIRAGEEFRSFNDVSCKQKLQKYVCGSVLALNVDDYFVNVCQV